MQWRRGKMQNAVGLCMALFHTVYNALSLEFLFMNKVADYKSKLFLYILGQYGAVLR